MNKYQFELLRGKAFHEYPHYRFLSKAVVGTAIGVGSIAAIIPYKNLWISLAWIISGSEGLKYAINRGLCGLIFIEWQRKLSRARREIESNPGQYPIENAENVCIEDLIGMEQILSRTAEAEPKEWATLIDEVYERGCVRITQIADSHECEQTGIVYERTESSVRIRNEYQDAIMHYHPPHDHLFPINYCISPIDRLVGKANSLHLLSFNTPIGPEIIGYNLRHLYVSRDKPDVLHRTSFRELWDRLGDLSI